MITNMEKNIQKDNTRVLILTGSSIPSEMEKIIYMVQQIQPFQDLYIHSHCI